MAWTLVGRKKNLEAFLHQQRFASPPLLHYLFLLPFFSRSPSQCYCFSIWETRRPHFLFPDWLTWSFFLFVSVSLFFSHVHCMLSPLCGKPKEMKRILKVPPPISQYYIGRARKRTAPNFGVSVLGELGFFKEKNGASMLQSQIWRHRKLRGEKRVIGSGKSNQDFFLQTPQRCCCCCCHFCALPGRSFKFRLFSQIAFFLGNLGWRERQQNANCIAHHVHFSFFSFLFCGEIAIEHSPKKLFRSHASMCRFLSDFREEKNAFWKFSV